MVRRTFGWKQFNVLYVYLYIGIMISPAMANYQSQEGRWMQQDPMQYVDGLNMYEYALSSPLLKSDALGLDTKDESKVCCKTKQTILVAGGGVFVTVSSCKQATIDNPRGLKPGEACKCQYRSQLNVEVYGAHSGKCCSCNVYKYRYLGGFMGFPSQAHQGINVICDQGRDSWSAEVWPESQEGFNPFIPHMVPVKMGTALDNSADGGRGIFMGEISCDAADSWKSVLSQTTWIYQFPFSECRDFTRVIGDEILKTCP